MEKTQHEAVILLVFGIWVMIIVLSFLVNIIVICCIPQTGWNNKTCQTKEAGEVLTDRRGN